MKFFFSLFTLLLILAVMLGALKRIRMRKLQAMFRNYNQDKDIKVILTWIQKGKTADRLADVLDYLEKIEDDELALQVVRAFKPQELTGRSVRVFAARAYLYNRQQDDALQTAEALMIDYPNDDSILEIYLDVLLSFQQWDKAEHLLLPRLQRKMEGTAFKALYARLLAGRGDKEQAVAILSDVVKKDYALYKNTFAPAQKRLIYGQYVRSQQILDEISGKTPEAEETEGQEG